MAQQSVGIHDHPEFKLGLIPPTPEIVASRWDVSSYIKTGLPKVPRRADYITAVRSWNLGRNNQFGTCGPTSLANFMTMAYKALKNEDITVSDDAIFALYRLSGNPDFNPLTGAGDRGVDMNRMLLAARQFGLDITHSDGTVENVKLVAYGTVPNQPKYLRAVTAIFGGVELALDLQVAQQTQMHNQPPVWDYAPSAEWGGHAVVGASYSGHRSGADEGIVTWATPVGLTDRFIMNQDQAAFAVVLPIHLSSPGFLEGVNVAAFARDYKTVTGQDFPG